MSSLPIGCTITCSRWPKSAFSNSRQRAYFSPSFPTVGLPVGLFIADELTTRLRGCDRNLAHGLSRAGCGWTFDVPREPPIRPAHETTHLLSKPVRLLLYYCGVTRSGRRLRETHAMRRLFVRAEKTHSRIENMMLAFRERQQTQAVVV